jgi:hypothetical protein
MVEQINAYKCEVTGAVFEDKQRAIRSEFRARMRQAAGCLPAMGSINPRDILDWMSSNIESGVYPNFLGELQEALAYWRENGSL